MDRTRYIGKGRIVERSTLSLDAPATEELEEQSPTPPSHQISPLGLSDTGEYNDFGNDNSGTKERRQQQSLEDTDGGSSIIGYEDPIRLNESTHCKFISANLLWS